MSYNIDEIIKNDEINNYYINFDLGNPVSLLINKSNRKKDKIIFIDNVDDDNVIKYESICANKNEYCRIIPNIIDKNQIAYICAPHQSGKSTFVSSFVDYYIKLYPKKRVFLFSNLKEDESLDVYKKIKRVNIEKFFSSDNEIDLDKFKNSLIIYDDILDSTHDKVLNKKIMNLCNNMLFNGAHYKIYLLITNHQISDYKKTRDILHECNSITIFPRSGSSYQIERVLKLYFGLDDQQIKKIMNLNSRYVTIFKTTPQYIFHRKGVYLI